MGMFFGLLLKGKVGAILLQLGGLGAGMGILVAAISWALPSAPVLMMFMVIMTVLLAAFYLLVKHLEISIK